MLAVLIVFVIVGVIYSFRFEKKEESVLVGGVFIGECTDSGWNESHYDGILSACEDLGCRFSIRERVPEEEAALRKAVRGLCKEGCSAVFLTSYGYGLYADRIAEDFPGVAFYSVSGEGKADNCMSYLPRMYQARYLSGIVAGATSRTGILGAVVSMPLPETNRLINAYALGARLANPDARIILYFTGSWDDQAEEEAAVTRLVAKGADVITYHEDKPYAIDAAERSGVYSIGYDGVYKEYSDRFLTAAVFKWDILYERVLGDFLSGRANFSNDYWLGISDGAVSLYPYSIRVGKRARKLVEKEKVRIQTWRDVFSGEIYDNTGRLRCGKDERISDSELFYGMEWYVDGVETYAED